MELFTSSSSGYDEEGVRRIYEGIGGYTEF